jgi:hypothetical protein
MQFPLHNTDVRSTVTTAPRSWEAVMFIHITWSFNHCRLLFVNELPYYIISCQTILIIHTLKRLVIVELFWCLYFHR